MKKIIALLLACMMIIGMLAACGQAPDAPVADAPADAQAVPAGSDPDKELPCARYYRRTLLYQIVC